MAAAAAMPVLGPLLGAVGIAKLAKPLFGKAKDLFGSSSPKPPEAPPTIAPDTLGVQEKAGETSRRRSRARGYRSTILSQQFMTPDAPALKDTIGS